MPRPTIKIKLNCFKCKKDFEILRWEFSNKGKRGTKKYFCSSKCKNYIQSLGGELSGTWKGGRSQYPSQKGYVMLRIAPNKRIFEHRYVMEKYLKRKLKHGEVVHHINGKTDDNRIKNLVVCESAGKHISKYHSKRRSVNHLGKTKKTKRR